MNAQTITVGDKEIDEIISKEIIIKDTQDAVDIIGNASSMYIVLYEHNLEKDFFDLSTGKLGDVLQKFTNFRVSLAIIGDFEKYTSETLKDFIYESNKHGNYLFVSSLDDVKRIWA